MHSIDGRKPFLPTFGPTQWSQAVIVTMKHQRPNSSGLHVKSSQTPRSCPTQWLGCPLAVQSMFLTMLCRTPPGFSTSGRHRSRDGVYLSQSPLHAATVALVLNLQTGRVSPQFHVQFDPAFQTVNPAFGGTSPDSNWQAICGFISEGPAEKREQGPLLQQSGSPHQLQFQNFKGFKNSLNQRSWELQWTTMISPLPPSVVWKRNSLLEKNRRSDAPPGTDVRWKDS